MNLSPIFSKKYKVKNGFLFKGKMILDGENLKYKTVLFKREVEQKNIESEQRYDPLRAMDVASAIMMNSSSRQKYHDNEYYKQVIELVEFLLRQNLGKICN